MDMIVLLLLLCLQYCEGDSKTCFVVPASNRVENAALNKPATQSSIYKTGKPSKAVDGDTNPRYSGGSCIHTDWETGLPLYQWWMVDLEREYRIDSVSITNRLNCAGRQRDFDIFVSLNSTFEDDDHMADDSLCFHLSGEMGSGETRTFTCQTPVFGQFVQIFMVTLDKRNMNICEVTVQGYPAVCSENKSTETPPPPTTTLMTTEAVQTTSTTIQNVSATSTQLTTTSEPTEDETTSMWLSTTLETTTDEALRNTTSPTSTSLKTAETTTAVTTTTSMTTSTLLTLPGNNTTTATPTCLCVCGVSSNTTNLTQEALVELVKELTKELTVNKKETRMSKRKLISVGDKRQSAEAIGFVGVLALCVPVLLIVSFDLINLWSFAKRTKNRVIIK